MEFKMLSAHLEYFKNLLQGEADISYSAYLWKNELEFKNLFPRGQFLRLKFSPFEEMESLLSKAGIEYTVDAHAVALERYYLLFEKSALDERGKLTSNHIDNMFDGAIRHYRDGALELAEKCIQNYIGLSRKPPSSLQLERFEELAFVAEIEMKYHDRPLGQFLFSALERIPTDHPRILDLKNVAAIAKQGSE